MSFQHHNRKSSSDNNVIPDVELTTASEVDRKPFEDDKDGQSEQDEDQDRNQKVARCGGYKVGSFLILYSFDLIMFNRFPSMSVIVVLRYVNSPKTLHIVGNAALKVPKISQAAQKARPKKVAKVWHITCVIATMLILLIPRTGLQLERRRIIE